MPFVSNTRQAGDKVNGSRLVDRLQSIIETSNDQLESVQCLVNDNCQIADGTVKCASLNNCVRDLFVALPVYGLTERDTTDLGDGVFQITPSQYNRVGLLRWSKKAKIDTGALVTFDFCLDQHITMNPITLPAGADGIAVVFSQTRFDAVAIGGAIGYNDIPTALAIELDTFNNIGLPEDDPSGNHVAVMDGTTGVVTSQHPVSEIAVAEAPIDLQEESWHSVEVLVSEDSVSMKIDGIQAIKADVDLSTIMEDCSVYVSITGATGLAASRQRVRNLTLQGTDGDPLSSLAGEDEVCCPQEIQECSPIRECTASRVYGTESSTDEVDGAVLENLLRRIIEQQNAMAEALGCVLNSDCTLKPGVVTIASLNDSLRLALEDEAL